MTMRVVTSARCRRSGLRSANGRCFGKRLHGPLACGVGAALWLLVGCGAHSSSRKVDEGTRAVSEQFFTLKVLQYRLVVPYPLGSKAELVCAPEECSTVVTSSNSTMPDIWAFSAEDASDLRAGETIDVSGYYAILLHSHPQWGRWELAVIRLPLEGNTPIEFVVACRRGGAPCGLRSALSKMVISSDGPPR
jgi:hypothetical protein